MTFQVAILIDSWLLIWLALGMVIYYGYGKRHSKLRLGAENSQ